MNQIAKSPTLDTHSSWQAQLSLGLAKTARGTVLKTCSHRGPLYVQKPFYPEGRELAHLYLLHPPGGMVSGDDLQISVTTQAQAKALITTPGAGRVYRARPDRSLQKQQITLTLEPDSCLEWLPLENIIYPDAVTALNTDIHLSAGSRIIAWEVTCFGLKASNQAFDQGEVAQRLQVFKEGRLKLREKLVLSPEQNRFMQTKAGLDGNSVNGLLLAGPFSSEDCTQAQHEQLLSQLREQCDNCASLAAVSQNDEFIQVRYLGDCSEQGRKLFTRCWALIRPHLMQRDSCEPRIWAT